MSEIISLEDILKQLYAISGILIDVYDLEGHSVARYPDTGAYFCSLVTRNSQGCERCGRDNREAFATVREEHKVHIYRCHMGLYEAVFPLYHYGRLAGYMMTGQMLEKREGAAEEVMQKARQMNLGSEEEIAEGVKKLVRIDLEEIGAFVTMCRVCADYIANHHQFPVTATGTAKEIIRVRLTNACRSLRNSEKSIYSVAVENGFSNQNYFSRQFKKYIGCTPGEYRRNQEREGGQKA